MAATSSSGEGHLPTSIRLATFNVHGFQLAPVVSNVGDERKALGDVIAESGADIIALQEVLLSPIDKDTQPLRTLADYLGMTFAFGSASSPYFGNAVMSKFDLRRSGVQHLSGGMVRRSIVRTCIDTPLGNLNFHSIHLDDMNEGLRLMQLTQAVGGSEKWEGISKEEHFLVGDFNALHRADYSSDEWLDISEERERNEWEPPRSELMSSVFSQGALGNGVDAYKDSFGHSRDRQRDEDQNGGGHCRHNQHSTMFPHGTCRFATRVDYILLHGDTTWRFVPDSYSVLPNHGTTDHQLVVVDIERVD